MPVWGPDNVLFMSSAYTGGSQALKLTRVGGKTTVEELWKSNRMRVHFTNVIRIGDHVYGSSGDFGPTPFTCIEVRTGKVIWQDRAFAKANMLKVDGKVVLVDEEGQLAVVTVSPAGLKVLAKTSLLSSNAWTGPIMDGKRLYVRDRKKIMAVGME